MRQKQQAHEGWLVGLEKLQCLTIGKVSFAPTDAVLQMPGVPSLFEHILVVVGFQECGVALPEIADHMRTRQADICKDTNSNIFSRYSKAVGVCCVMQLGERNNGKSADLYRFKCLE